MKKGELIERIHAVWRDGEEFVLCLAILDLIQKFPSASHIPMSRFQELAREKSLIRDPFLPHRVVQYLCGADSPVLSLGAELIDDEDESVYRLKEDELQLAVQSSINPLTGAVDADLKNRIYVYFYPSDFAKRVLSDAAQK